MNQIFLIGKSMFFFLFFVIQCVSIKTIVTHEFVTERLKIHKKEKTIDRLAYIYTIHNCEKAIEIGFVVIAIIYIKIVISTICIYN